MRLGINSVKGVIMNIFLPIHVFVFISILIIIIVGIIGGAIEERNYANREYIEERKKQKLKDKNERYKRKIERRKQRYAKKADNQEQQDIEEEKFLKFLKFANEQTGRFSLYSCKNNKALQILLDETFLSISRLTTKLDADNYTAPEIFEFYSIELEQFFILLGEGPIFTVTKNSYEKLCSCLKTIERKATRIEESIREWQGFTINVKLDALIEYIND